MATNQKFVETDINASGASPERQAWMKTLATSPKDAVESLWQQATDLNEISCEVIRKPERGLVMVRGRAGSAGERFNLGEMTVSRCAVRIEGGYTGVSYIAGRDLDHALIAAKLDAFLQSDAHRQEAFDKVITPLRDAKSKDKQDRAEKVAATRVNFFTMVRTREDKK